MNQKTSGETTPKNIKKTQTKTNYKETIKLTKGDDIMNQIDEIKSVILKGTTHYVPGIKFVTYETAETVLRTIRKDLRIYEDTVQFVIYGNFLEVVLSSNATVYTYYFTKKEVRDEVIKKLPEFNIPIVKL